MKYILGLDVGIGSIGWAVIKDDNDIHNRIEDFGVRIFNSGEVPNKKERYSQVRRGYRSSRRLIRRRWYRKWRIKAHFENIGLCKIKEIEEYFETASPNIIALRVKALDEQILPQELAACLINICNHRGYNPFYDDNNDASKDEKEEAKENQAAIGRIKSILADNRYRTVGEMIYKHNDFNVKDSEFKKYRNNKYDGAEKILFSREMMQNEVGMILKKQSEYYTQLTENNIEIINDIIFSQRDFEDGPGDKDDKYRKYKGFLDSMGKCTFYKDEPRGFRFTLLSDVYSLVNTLSQMIYTDINTAEIGLSRELAKALVDFAVKKGKIGKTDIKKIAKQYGKIVSGEDDADYGKCFKSANAVKPIVEQCGYDWMSLSADYIDENSQINEIGKFLSENITPSRRQQKSVNNKAFSGFDDDFIQKLNKIKTTGTTNACFRFMRESIEAFLDGESYGSFQAKTNKVIDSHNTTQKYKILPAFDSSCEFTDNPVVLRAVNETRKIINAVIRKYGSPCAVNIEVGSELNKSFEQRDKDRKKQLKNEKATQNVKNQITELFRIEESKITPSMIERFKLGEEQGWKCLYSGIEIKDKREACLNINHTYEVDHIVPFSLILDNTLKNKALVYHTQNQNKGNRTPLMYMSETAAKEYIGRVNLIYGGKKELYGSKTALQIKQKYLMLKDFSDSSLLDEWKSRNINDTRYISKYLVNYLRNTLEFADNEETKYIRQPVYAVKSSITSKLRRQWLNEITWGIKDKDELKKLTCLDHAVDAIVIANCIPAYVEMVALNQKLKDIYYSAGRVKNKEYNDTLDTAVKNLRKYYGISEKHSYEMLTKIKTTPSFIPNLREEVEIRVFDCEMQRYFLSDKSLKDDELTERYRKNVEAFYSYDSEFAASLKMPLFSLKQEKKINKAMFNDLPISVKEIDGKKYQIKTVDIMNIKKDDIPNIYTNDKKLIAELYKLMANVDAGEQTEKIEKAEKNKKTEKTVKDALEKIGLKRFVYNGRQVNRLKKKLTAPSGYFTKEISDNNNTILSDDKYYCVEIYETVKGKTGVCGIKYSDLVLKNGKLYLSDKREYPNDYKEYKMYLFSGDYISVTKGKTVFYGYYKSVYNINQGYLNLILYNNSNEKSVYINQETEIKKFYVDILGKKGGVINGEPLSSITEKN